MRTKEILDIQQNFLMIFLFGLTLPANASEVTPAAVIPSQNSQESAVFQAFLSPAPDAHSIVYEVKKGDNLTTIAKAHQVTADLIKKVNGLLSDKLIPGKKLKIPTYKMSLWVDKSDNTLTLKGDNERLKTYVVSTGADNSTPVGVFKITDKLINPTWYKAGAVVPPESPQQGHQGRSGVSRLVESRPQNVLGTRWIGITAKGYGIHGTVEPEKLGQQVTAGCVRMKNEEVEELYFLVVPGTEVTIQD